MATAPAIHCPFGAVAARTARFGPNLDHNPAMSRATAPTMAVSRVNTAAAHQDCRQTNDCRRAASRAPSRNAEVSISEVSNVNE